MICGGDLKMLEEITLDAKSLPLVGRQFFRPELLRRGTSIYTSYDAAETSNFFRSLKMALYQVMFAAFCIEAPHALAKKAGSKGALSASNGYRAAATTFNLRCFH
jgi:hypothetical protein